MREHRNEPFSSRSFTIDFKRGIIFVRLKEKKRIGGRERTGEEEGERQTVRERERERGNR